MKRFFSKIKKPQWLEQTLGPLVEEGDILARAANARLNAASASDPGEWERVFAEKWKNTMEIMDRKVYEPEHVPMFDEIVTVVENISAMCTLLMLEVNAQPEPAIGPILEQYFSEQILERVMDWGIQLTSRCKNSFQIALIKMYETIVAGSHSQNHCILVHKPILNPFLRLCESARRLDELWYLGSVTDHKGEVPVDTHLAQLLHQVCTKIAGDRTLLHFFFNNSSGSEDFLIFTQLVTLIYKRGNCGQFARDSLLTLLSVTSSNPEVTKFICQKTSLCAVIGAGLCGCFSELPNTILGDGGERLVGDEDWESLADYHSALLFCNAVAQTAHKDVTDELTSFFYSAFLIGVVKPALLQDDRESVAASMAYFNFCVQTITEGAVVKSIARMLLTEFDDKGVIMFERIISYVKAGDKTAIVAISLLKTLIQMGIEDFMLASVFRPLLTNHVANKKQLAKIYDRDRCGELAQKFLDCIPSCMLGFEEIVSQPIFFRYLQESRVQMDARSEQCRLWKWKYDGVVAGSFCLPSESDDDATCHVSFSRMSSNRSTMSSMAAQGLNKYSSSGHYSHDFNIEKVCDLGQKLNIDDEDEYRDEIEKDDIEEDQDFVLPVDDEMTASKVMSASTTNYLHISGLDDQGESDDSIPVLSKISTEEDLDDPESSESFVLSGWQDVKDDATWRSLLDRQKIVGEVMSGPQLVEFMNSRFEKLKDGEEEEAEKEDLKDKDGEEDAKITVEKNGFSVYRFSERSSLLKMLFDNIESMCDNSMSFNAELCSLLSSLATYPQPILAHFLFDPKEDESQKCLLTILQSIQTRIEVLADGLEDFDVMVKRAVRSLTFRAERLEKRKFDNTVFHLTRNSPDELDDEKSKQAAIVAVCMTHLCQLLASIVLQQALLV